MATVQEAAYRAYVRCDEVALYTDEPGRVTRLAYTAAMRRAHGLVTDWMLGAGLDVRVDAAGTLIGRRSAKNPDAPVLLIGSHLDSVPNAGKYDGVLGVLLGVALAEVLGDEALPFHLDIVGFPDEEGVRFKRPYLGSRTFAGRFVSDWLGAEDLDGVSMAEAMRRFGLDPDAIVQAAYDPQRVLGYIEPHLEQGPVLETEQLAVGLVTAISGQQRTLLRYVGEAGHAGTVPMSHRRDAGVAAGRFINMVHEHAMKTPGLRATVGHVRFEPNARNVIPGVAHLSLDARHEDNEVRRRSVQTILENAQAIGVELNVELYIDRARPEDSVRMDTQLNRHLAEAIEQVNRPVRWITSGAGHDAVAVADLCPVALLFIRHPGGVSHHPDEAVLPEDLPIALEVLRRAVFNLAGATRSDTTDPEPPHA